MLVQAAAVTMSGVHESIDQALPRALDWSRQAVAEGVKAVFFPELILGHYFETPVSLAGPEIASISREAQGLGVSIAIGAGERVEKQLFSAYVLCSPDGSVSVHRKTRWQTPKCPIDLGKECAAHAFSGVRVGVMICSESRFPDVAQSLVASRAQLLVAPHAYGKSPKSNSGNNSWQPLEGAVANVLALRARETKLPVIVVAATGEGFDGGCALLGTEGDVLYQAYDARERMHRFLIRLENGVANLVRVSHR